MNTEVQSLNHALALVAEMAQQHVEDIESGLEDGTYEPENNTDLTAKKAALDVVKQHLSAGKNFLLVIEGDVSPYLVGHYQTGDDVLAAARAHRKGDPEGEDGLFTLSIDQDGRPQVDSFSGAELEPEDD